MAAGARPEQAWKKDNQVGSKGRNIRDETEDIGRNQTTRQDLTMVLRKFVFILKVIGSH